MLASPLQAELREKPLLLPLLEHTAGPIQVGVHTPADMLPILVPLCSSCLFAHGHVILSILVHSQDANTWSCHT